MDEGGPVLDKSTQHTELHDSQEKTVLLSQELQNFVASELMKLPPTLPRRIKRPPNCFILFAKDNRRKIKRRFPNLSNRAVSCYLGRQWKQLEKKTRNYYQHLADSLSRDHKNLYPNYVYSPCEARKQKAERIAFRSMRESSYMHEKYRMPLARNKPVCILSRKNEPPASEKAKEAQELETIEVIIMSTDSQTFVSTEDTTEFPSEDAELLPEVVEQPCQEKKNIEYDCLRSAEMGETNIEEKEINQNELTMEANEMVAIPDDLSSSREPLINTEDVNSNLEEENPADENNPMTEGTSHFEGNGESIDVPMGADNFQHSPFIHHSSSPATGDNGRPLLPCDLPGPAFNVEVPFYPSVYPRQRHHYNSYYMPNEHVPVPVDSFRETQTNSSMALPSFSRAFDSSFPSFQVAVPHHSMHFPVYASPETSSVMAPRLSSSSTQMDAPYHSSHFVEYMPHVAGSHRQLRQFHSSTPMVAPQQRMPVSEHVAPEVNPCVPSCPFSEMFVPYRNMYPAPVETISPTSYQAAVPIRNIPLSNYMLLESDSYVRSPHPYHPSPQVAILPHRSTFTNMHYSHYVPAQPGSYEPCEASLPPYYYQPENIAFNYSAHVPAVMRNDINMENAEQSPSDSNSS